MNGIEQYNKYESLHMIFKYTHTTSIWHSCYGNQFSEIVKRCLTYFNPRIIPSVVPSTKVEVTL